MGRFELKMERAKTNAKRHPVQFACSSASTNQDWLVPYKPWGDDRQGLLW